MEAPGARGPVAAELSRRRFLALGMGALIATALPYAESLYRANPALAAVAIDDATLQAFADTVIPGRKVARTDLGDEIHPDAIAGVDSLPGAVEADALRGFHDPLIGFPSLAPAFLADLSVRSLQQGGPFLSLSFDKRTAVLLAAYDFGNPGRVLYEAAAAVPFACYCGAGEVPGAATSANASGYRTMGYPGAAPNGYSGFSYRKRLAQERTRKGYLA